MNRIRALVRPMQLLVRKLKCFMTSIYNIKSEPDGVSGLINLKHVCNCMQSDPGKNIALKEKILSRFEFLIKLYLFILIVSF